MPWKKPPTELTVFRPFILRDAFIYHRVYHYSLSLHLNHLVFLNTYLFGVMLMLAAVPRYHEWPVALYAGLTAYLGYIVALVPLHLSLPYGVLLSAMAFSGAVSVREQLSEALGSPCEASQWPNVCNAGWSAAAGFGLVFVSLCFQLIGHALHEEFQAPPSPAHGFFAAPPLEWLSLLHRCGLRPSSLADVEEEVEAVRQRARPLAGGAASRSSELTAHAAIAIRHARNVWEHHARALYINIPISKMLAEALSTSHPSVKPACYGGHSWLSILVDDLDKLWWCAGVSWVPTGMRGWMTKCNLLVEGSVGEDCSPRVSGYQLLSLAFEAGVSGSIKAAAARATQRVPSSIARYRVSSGRSGESMRSSLTAGTSYSASMSCATACLLEVQGVLEAPTSEEAAFARFVCERPHKFLAQDGGARMAYSPETGEGASFSADGVMTVRHTALQVEALLQPLGLGPADLDLSAAVCFLQPEYVLVDHHNTVLPVPCPSGS